MNDEKRRLRVKGRRTSGSFLKLDKELLAHPNFLKLTPRSVKLLVDLGYYYNGSNNKKADLVACDPLLAEFFGSPGYGRSLLELYAESKW